MVELVERAQILIEALPYIKEFYGKTIVVKYGGSAMLDEVLKENTILDFILMKYIGVRLIIVHGGGKSITEMMKDIAVRIVLFLSFT